MNGGGGAATTIGFFTALASTLFGNINSVYTKVLLRHDTFSSKELNCLVAWLCFVLAVPAFLLIEDIPVMKEALHKPATLWSVSLPSMWMLVINALCYFLQSILGFLLLSNISYLSFSVMGTIKRVFVVLLAVLLLQNQISFIQGLGVALAMSGTAFYSLWPRRKELKRTKSMATLLPVFNQAQRD
eukprot:CAMPEP_0113882214 /NCGR_PEP_ID=MMETSP0780_2-20120614/8823_1 /TAXON_ID=652834 /ORGANISM="Palpitomonas bilix" /LENGTH=185 /DNA_ID=CAMNT_0000869189 /DNA_START=714 /DNA_END=1271 /DNA_ORIENTATION=- /assembly_acc=CAM_ASM_000599